MTSSNQGLFTGMFFGRNISSTVHNESTEYVRHEWQLYYNASPRSSIYLENMSFLTRESFILNVQDSGELWLYIFCSFPFLNFKSTFHGFLSLIVVLSM